jgi:hypothetical protein
MPEIIVMDWIPLPSQLLDDCLQVDGRPEHNGIGDKVETSYLVDLCLVPTLPDLGVFCSTHRKGKVGCSLF